MEIGFGGFVNVIDALEGIRMCLPNAIKDRDSHLDLPKGCQTLSGVPRPWATSGCARLIPW